ncbi:MAG: ATP-binding protein [Telluria sp.]
MRFSIGHRLFAAVLLALLAVAATGIGLLRQRVAGSFADYAVQIELDRLGELTASAARQYAERGGWQFLPSGEAAQRSWPRTELARLELRRRHEEVRASMPPAPDQSPARTRGPIVSPTPPAAPPAPPAPPLPPLPPPAVEAEQPVASPRQLADAPLQDRITLFDAAHHYLAGQPPSSAPSAERTLAVDGRTVGYLAVTRPLRPSDAPALAFLAELKDAMVVIVGASLVLSAVAAMLLAAHFRKPIHRLADGARELAAGRFDAHIEAGRSDELGDLARSFNQLAERLAAMETSRRQWVADTSHELRTPLSVLRAQLEAMQDGVRPLDGQAIAAMLRQVLSLNRLIDELYVLAKADVGALECRHDPLDLAALAREEADAFAPRLAAAGLALELDLPAPCTCRGDAERLRQVLRNLLENSLRYTHAGGRVRVGVTCGAHEAVLAIDDTAPAVPDAALARLAERFYRVDASRSRGEGGAGLGLALCERIVQAHGGRLAFVHSDLGGLRVTVTLPRGDA